jgi:hypothetical protein
MNRDVRFTVSDERGEGNEKMKNAQANDEKFRSRGKLGRVCRHFPFLMSFAALQ